MASTPPAPPPPPQPPPPPSPPASGQPALSPDERRAGFEEEALVHLDALYRVALRLTGNASDAEDLVQETMLRAYRSWERYTRGTNAKGWLLTILRHLFINEYRRKSRHPETVDVDTIEAFALFQEVQEADPQGAFFDRIVDEEVQRAVDQLPDAFREAVTLSDVEGLSYEEVAKVLDVPVGTVKSRLYRGRRLLQAKLYEYAVSMGYIKGQTKK
jgi:RNA polymerase sigma-70 factor (ECF subfamily)